LCPAVILSKVFPLSNAMKPARIQGF
jgi:hypothetical protein